MLLLQDLHVTYPGKPPVEAVKGVTMSCPQGCTTVLLGASGSGKTAISMAALGLLPPGSTVQGELIWQENQQSTPLNALKPEARRTWTGQHFGWVAQGAQSALHPTRTISSLLGEAVRVHCPTWDQQRRMQEIFTLAEALNLHKKHLDAYPHQLSGGERQRWLLALALVSQPDLLIADEPTTSLDPRSEEQMLNLLRCIQQERGLGILLITHDLTVAARMADTCYLLEEGKLHPDSGGQISVLRKPGGPLAPRPKPEGQPNIKPGEPLMTVKGLEVRYEARGNWFTRSESVQALHPLDVEIRQGECLGVVGLSGSGKSSLAKALLGLVPAEGNVQWHRPERPMAQRVQLILQDAYGSLHPRFRIGDVVVEVIRRHQPTLSRSERILAAKKLLELVQLPVKAFDKYPSQLSGGERQRANLARALAPNPSLLILDESLSSLDRSLQSEMLALLRQLIEEQGKALMLISHDLHMVRGFCEKLLLLDGGQIIETGDTEAILTTSTHPATLALVRAASQL